MTRDELIEKYKAGERNFIEANLRGANLSDANLRESVGLQLADCSWYQHGECGRKLTAVRIKKNIQFFCGCFKGDESELRQYIAKGKEEYRASRTKAMEFLLSCFEVD